MTLCDSHVRGPSPRPSFHDDGGNRGRANDGSEGIVRAHLLTLTRRAGLKRSVRRSQVRIHGDDAGVSPASLIDKVLDGNAAVIDHNSLSGMLILGTA